ncbi:MAG: hypothetical protein ACUVRV_03350 [Cyanobacteriota bacterium]
MTAPSRLSTSPPQQEQLLWLQEQMDLRFPHEQIASGSVLDPYLCWDPCICWEIGQSRIGPLM